MSTSHLEARKDQNELSRWVGKAASWPIWFLQLPPTTPNKIMELGPSVPTTQELCQIPKGNTELWVFQN